MEEKGRTFTEEGQGILEQSKQTIIEMIERCDDPRLLRFVQSYLIKALA